MQRLGEYIKESCHEISPFVRATPLVVDMQQLTTRGYMFVYPLALEMLFRARCMLAITQARPAPEHVTVRVQTVVHHHQ